MAAALWFANSGDVVDGDDADDDGDGDDVDDDDTDKSPLESRKSNALALDDVSNVLLAFESGVVWVGDDTVGVTGAELQLIGIWHWRQSIDLLTDTGVAGNDEDFDAVPDSLVT